MGTPEVLMEIYHVLRKQFGHREWWPGQGEFEVMAGAILTQRTNWQNVEKAIENLREAGVLEADALAAIDREKLQQLVRPAGYYRQKAARLQRLARWVAEKSTAGSQELERWPTDELRQELLAIRGIGPETADSILLYALERPTFVVDTYTKRITARHGLVDRDCGYFELKSLFVSNLPREVELYKDYHAQLVELGKRHCRPTPRCEDCPARPLLGEPCLEEF